jgi:phosphoglycerate dehydrogenase-like enzyme
MSPLRIAVLDDYQQAAGRFADWSTLPGPAEVVTLREHIGDPDELVAALSGFDVVVAMRERTALPSAVLHRLNRVRLVVTTGMSNAAIDLDAAADVGITVAGTGGFVTPTSELTWGLILALARHIPAEDAAVRAGGWQETVGMDLAGRTLGLVGLGNIGKLVAEVAKAFRMRVVAWSPNLTPERCAEAGVQYVEEDELFQTADVVSIHMVLSERTRGLVGERQLSLMKATALLVNTSRGPIVDELALAQALADGKIAGAGLDVFGTEPLPAGHPLRRTPNTILTPHIGYVTDRLYELFYREVVEDVAAWMAGVPVRVLAAPDAPKPATAGSTLEGTQR